MFPKTKEFFLLLKKEILSIAINIKYSVEENNLFEMGADDVSCSRSVARENIFGKLGKQ